MTVIIFTHAVTTFEILIPARGMTVELVIHATTTRGTTADLFIRVTMTVVNFLFIQLPFS
jgi:hypothetical protein